MQKKVNQNKEFRTFCRYDFAHRVARDMHKPKSINELLSVGGKRLTALRAATQERTVALKHVCAALPPQLAEVVVSAGIDKGRLTIGVTGAQWASRIRYLTDTLRTRVSGTMGVGISSIRIRVVPPRA